MLWFRVWHLGSYNYPKKWRHNLWPAHQAIGIFRENFLCTVIKNSDTPESPAPIYRGLLIQSTAPSRPSTIGVM